MPYSPRGLDAEQLVQAQELVHVGAWTWDVQADEVRWSDELFRLLGLPPQSIPLQLNTYLAFVHPMDRERVSGIIAASLAAKCPFEFDSRIITKQGTTVHHLSRGDVLCDERGTATQMIGACIDITDRMAQQEALRASEERFRSIFEQSAVGMALAGSDGRLVQSNASFARFLGYTRGELRTLTLLDITHQEDAERTRAMMQMRDPDSLSYTYEKRYVRKDGTIVWGRATVSRVHHDDGSVAGYMGVVEDITASRVARESLVRQTEQLQTIMDHLPVMVSIFDRDGKPIFLNRQWQKIMGWTLEEARELDIIAEVYPDPAEAERCRRAIEISAADWADYEMRVRDGRIVPSSWAGVRLSDGSVMTIGQDMTERRHMEQRLAQSQKMEALGQLAGGIAHDFNNLLTIISACATFVQDAMRGNESAMDDLKEITAATNRAAALTRQLLAFSRRQMLKSEIVDVNNSIQVMGKTLSRLIGEHIELAIVADATNAIVEADVHSLEQVILNLVVNARDAISDSGAITIDTRCVLRPDRNAKAPQYVAISVTDDGCGIEPAIRDRIFEPFFTTKAAGKGTGLGLATVHGIVAQTGGFIEVDSEVGKGTTFRVFLPTAPEGSCSPSMVSEAEELRGKGTVLLVEDEGALRAVARRVLVGLGYTVLEARHGADAARLSANHVGPIDLLITDVVMPELGGRELARIVRVQRPNARVLYISGYTDDELLRKGILEPGAQLLRKPFLPAELARAARDLLRPMSEAA